MTCHLSEAYRNPEPVSQAEVDFFACGKRDMLALVRRAQARGQWTKQVRARMLVQARSLHLFLKHTYPRMEISYFAGQLSALKSRLVMDFSGEHVDTALRDTEDAVTLIEPLPPGEIHFCGLFDCVDEALWGVLLPGESRPRLLLCNRCRQEWQRMETAYSTPDGWDWDEEEGILFPLAAPSQAEKRLARKEMAIELAPHVLPFAVLLGFACACMVFPASHSAGLVELLLVVLARWQGKNLVRVLFFLGIRARDGS